MTNLRVLIVDDEPQSRSLIRKLLSVHFPGLVAEEAETVNDSVEKIRQFSPGLVFLDVQMRGETGFDLLDNVKTPDFEIIFTTAHSEFALKAFRYSALDYLMKPIDADEFRVAVEKALVRIKNQHTPGEQISFLKELRLQQKPPDKLTLPTPEGFFLINIGDILYCHAAGNYTEFHLADRQKIVSSYTLGYYEEILTNHRFFRSHRSYLVNLTHIKMYRKGEGGTLVMDNGDEIEVSRTNKEAFLKFFKI